MSSSSSTMPHLTDLSQFYKQLDDFKEKIITILKQFNCQQEIINLNKYYDKLLLIKQANARVPIEFIYEYGVKRFAEQILTRDETFFSQQITKIENHDPSTIDLGNQQDIFFINHLHQIWYKLSPIVKKNIWDYIQVICLLTERILNGNVLRTMKEELKISGKIK